MLLPLLVVLLGLGVHRLTRKASKHARGHAPAAVDSEPLRFSARRYPEPLISSQDLDLGEPVDDGDDDDETPNDEEVFKPREDRPAFDLKLPIDWAADPFKDRNWQFQLHSLGMVSAQLARYVGSKDSTYYRQALAFTLDWWRFHKGREHPPERAWYDMATGLRAGIVAYLLDRSFAGREKLSEPEQTSLLEMAQAHVVRLRNAKLIAHTNHGVFQIRNLSSLCRVLGEVADCDGAEAYVQQQLGELLETQFDEYGVHREHSPQYHRLAIEALQRFAQPQGEGVYKHIADRLELARAVFPWLVFPDGRLAALGDTEGEARSEPPPAARRCVDAAKADCVEVGDFSRSGYLVVRSPWSRPLPQAFMLIMTGMYNRRTHKHIDDLSFELMEQGQLLFEDSGKYAYLRNRMSRYARGVRAHSTIGLGSRELKYQDTDHYGSALLPPAADAGVQVLGGKVKRLGLFTQERRIDYAPGRYLLLDDDLRSSQTREYESYLHLAPELQPQPSGSAFVVPLGGGRSMRIESLSPDCTASVARGEKGRRYQGWSTKSYREMVPASVLTFACAGRNRHITLLASFDAASRTAGIARHALAEAAATGK